MCIIQIVAAKNCNLHGANRHRYAVIVPCQLKFDGGPWCEVPERMPESTYAPPSKLVCSICTGIRVVENVSLHVAAGPALRIVEVGGTVNVAVGNAE